MLPATSWEELDWTSTDSVRGWSVMNRLQERQRIFRQYGRGNHLQADRSNTSAYMVPAGSIIDLSELQRSVSQLRFRRTVLAFLFTQPDTAVIDELDRRGRYFDRVTGDTWDLFFPGYFQTGDAHITPQSFTPVGQDYARNWYFDEDGFVQLSDYIEDMLRKHKKGRSGQTTESWCYSGETDLVIMEVTIPYQGVPQSDWVNWGSAVYGSVTANESLSQLITSVAHDLKHQEEDPNFGVGHITSNQPVNQTYRTRGRLMNIGDSVLAGLLLNMLPKIFGS